MKPSEKPIPPTNTQLDAFNSDFGQTLVTENLGMVSSGAAKKL